MKTQNRQLLIAYRDRWRAVEAVEREEHRTASVALPGNRPMLSSAWPWAWAYSRIVWMTRSKRSIGAGLRLKGYA
jgi:hypothetical protein